MINNESSYYQTLFLNKGEDDQRKIKNNYNKLVRLFHPDKNKSNALLFQNINNAYQVLSHPVLKIIYDQLGKDAVSLYENNQKRLNKMNQYLSSNDNPDNEKPIEEYKQEIINAVRRRLVKKVPYSSFEVSYNILSNKTNFAINTLLFNGLSFGFVSQDMNNSKNKIIKVSNYSFGNKYYRLEGEAKFDKIKKLYSNNNIIFAYRSFSFIPSIQVNNLKVSVPNVKIGYNYKDTNSFLYDIIQKAFTINGSYERAKKNTFKYSISFSSIYAELNLINKRDNKKYSEVYGFHISNKNLMFSNEVSSRTFHPNIGFGSKLVLHRNYFCENILNLKLQFNNVFSLDLPLLIYKPFDFISVIILLFPTIYKMILKKYAKRYLYSLYDKINKNNQEYYNKTYCQTYNEIIENESKELLIIYAIIGKSSTIKEIVKHNKSYKEYKNVFDIKIPLMMNVVNNKLILPLNILSIEGIYTPEHEYRNDLSYFIKYRYKKNTYTILEENNNKEIIIP